MVAHQGYRLKGIGGGKWIIGIVAEFIGMQFCKTRGGRKGNTYRNALLSFGKTSVRSRIQVVVPMLNFDVVRNMVFGVEAETAIPVTGIFNNTAFVFLGGRKIKRGFLIAAAHAQYGVPGKTGVAKNFFFIIVNFAGGLGCCEPGGRGQHRWRCPGSDWPLFPP